MSNEEPPVSGPAAEGAPRPATPRHPFDDMLIVHQYTRAQAIADGILVDITAAASSAGFTIPVACTSAAWEKAIAAEGPADEEPERTLLLLRSLRSAIAAHRGHTDRLLFIYHAPQTSPLTLKAICGPGDHGEAVVTILLPHED